MNKIIKNGKTADVLMNKRTLDYLSLVAYMQTTSALQQQNLPASKMFCQIYLIIDPTNNEAHYLNAITLAIEGKDKEAMTALEEAVKNGFKDITRLESDNAFIKLKETDAFKAVLKKVNDANLTPVN